MLWTAKFMIYILDVLDLKIIGQKLNCASELTLKYNTNFHKTLFCVLQV